MQSTARHSPRDARPNDVLAFWHDAGCRGGELSYAKVLRVGPKRLQVRDEHGTTAWRYPRFFSHIVTDAELLAEIGGAEPAADQASPAQAKPQRGAGCPRCSPPELAAQDSAQPSPSVRPTITARKAE